MDYSLLFFPIFNNGYVNISFLTTFYIKSYIIALDPLNSVLPMSLANWSAFSWNMGPEMGSFLWLIYLNHSQINLLISLLPALPALLCFDERSLVSNSRKILSRFFKILSIWVFSTENFSANLRLPHPDLSLYLITSTFSFNVKVFFVCCPFGFPILSYASGVYNWV